MKCKNCGIESIILIDGCCSYECEVQWKMKMDDYDYQNPDREDEEGEING